MNDALRIDIRVTGREIKMGQTKIDQYRPPGEPTPKWVIEYYLNQAVAELLAVIPEKGLE